MNQAVSIVHTDTDSEDELSLTSSATKHTKATSTSIGSPERSADADPIISRRLTSRNKGPKRFGIDGDDDENESDQDETYTPSRQLVLKRRASQRPNMSVEKRNPTRNKTRSRNSECDHHLQDFGSSVSERLSTKGIHQSLISVPHDIVRTGLLDHDKSSTPGTWRQLQQQDAAKSLPTGKTNLAVPYAEGSTPTAKKRVRRACDLCRQKRIKCNGKKPCSLCDNRIGSSARVIHRCNTANWDIQIVNMALHHTRKLRCSIFKGTQYIQWIKAFILQDRSIRLHQKSPMRLMMRTIMPAQF